MADCIFCKIAAGQIPATIVHQDNDVVAFRDLNPQAPQHILFIPRQHIASMDELTSAHGDLLGKIFVAAQKVVRETELERGYRFVTNVGPDGGQSVAHLHFHLLGGKPLGWPPFPPEE